MYTKIELIFGEGQFSYDGRGRKCKIRLADKDINDYRAGQLMSFLLFFLTEFFFQDFERFNNFYFLSALLLAFAAFDTVGRVGGF
jgi:hypothetical protein